MAATQYDDGLTAVLAPSPVHPVGSLTKHPVVPSLPIGCAFALDGEGSEGAQRIELSAGLCHVEAFSRSHAGKDLGPMRLRHPRALEKAMHYLVHYYLRCPKDERFLVDHDEVWDYLWNRFRQIRTDWTKQLVVSVDTIRNDPMCSRLVQWLQFNVAAIFVGAAVRCRSAKSCEEFLPNKFFFLESVSQTYSDLATFYRLDGRCRGGEFVSIMMLFSGCRLMHKCEDRSQFCRFHRGDAVHAFEQPCEAFSLENAYKELEYYPNVAQSRHVQNALKVLHCLYRGGWFEFFELCVRLPWTPVQRCVLYCTFTYVRFRAVVTLVCRQPNRIPKSRYRGSLPIPTLTRLLLFDSETDCVSFLELIGLGPFVVGGPPEAPAAAESAGSSWYLRLHDKDFNFVVDDAARVDESLQRNRQHLLFPPHRDFIGFHSLPPTPTTTTVATDEDRSQSHRPTLHVDGGTETGRASSRGDVATSPVGSEPELRHETTHDPVDDDNNSSNNNNYVNDGSVMPAEGSLPPVNTMLILEAYCPLYSNAELGTVPLTDCDEVAFTEIAEGQRAFRTWLLSSFADGGGSAEERASLTEAPPTARSDVPTWCSPRSLNPRVPPPPPLAHAPPALAIDTDDESVQTDVADYVQTVVDAAAIVSTSASEPIWWGSQHKAESTTITAAAPHRPEGAGAVNSCAAVPGDLEGVVTPSSAIARVREAIAALTRSDVYNALLEQRDRARAAAREALYDAEARARSAILEASEADSSVLLSAYTCEINRMISARQLFANSQDAAGRRPLPHPKRPGLTTATPSWPAKQRSSTDDEGSQNAHIGPQGSAATVVSREGRRPDVLLESATVLSIRPEGPSGSAGVSVPPQVPERIATAPPQPPPSILPQIFNVPPTVSNFSVASPAQSLAITTTAATTTVRELLVDPRTPLSTVVTKPTVESPVVAPQVPQQRGVAPGDGALVVTAAARPPLSVNDVHSRSNKIPRYEKEMTADVVSEQPTEKNSSSVTAAAFVQPESHESSRQDPFAATQPPPLDSLTSAVRRYKRSRGGSLIRDAALSATAPGLSSSASLRLAVAAGEEASEERRHHHLANVLQPISDWSFCFHRTMLHFFQSSYTSVAVATALLARTAAGGSSIQACVDRWVQRNGGGFNINDWNVSAGGGFALSATPAHEPFVHLSSVLVVSGSGLSRPAPSSRSATQRQEVEGTTVVGGVADRDDDHNLPLVAKIGALLRDPSVLVDPLDVRSGSLLFHQSTLHEVTVVPTTTTTPLGSRIRRPPRHSAAPSSAAALERSTLDTSVSCYAVDSKDLRYMHFNAIASSSPSSGDRAAVRPPNHEPCVPSITFVHCISLMEPDDVPRCLNNLQQLIRDASSSTRFRICGLVLVVDTATSEDAEEAQTMLEDAFLRSWKSEFSARPSASSGGGETGCERSEGASSSCSATSFGRRSRYDRPATDKEGKDPAAHPSCGKEVLSQGGATSQRWTAHKASLRDQLGRLFRCAPTWTTQFGVDEPKRGTNNDSIPNDGGAPPPPLVVLPVRTVLDLAQRRNQDAAQAMRRAVLCCLQALSDSYRGSLDAAMRAQENVVASSLFGSSMIADVAVKFSNPHAPFSAPFDDDE